MTRASFTETAMKELALKVRSEPCRAEACFAETFKDLWMLRALAAKPAEGEPYGRKVLFRSDILEVMVADWAPNTECAPHDHDTASGVVWLAEGAFIEKHFRSTDTGLVPAEEGRLLPARSVMRVNSGVIHSCRSVGTGLSLHVYWPPILKMRVYDLRGRETYVVNGEGGAWLPNDPSTVLERLKWS